jgi:predicted house-cleaning noncanonical NTP pyrophosphatase (MazG superfamily)
MKKTNIYVNNKLWRDKAVDILETQHASIIVWEPLNDAAFDKELRIKLCEESEEVQAALSRDELIAELADVYEVLDTLMNLHTITKNDVVAMQQHKKEVRGGFEGRKYVKTSEHPVGSFGDKYCTANPTKYILVKEE